MIIVYFGLTPKSFLVGLTRAYSAKLGLFFAVFTGSLNSRRVKQYDVSCERSRMTQADSAEIVVFLISGLYSCIKFLLHRVLLTPDLKKQKHVIELLRDFA